MTKKKLPPYSPRITNPEADAINRLEAIGVRVEDTGGVWFVKRARDGAILPGTDPLRGYASRGRALTIAVATCSALMDCRRATNLAYTDYLPVAAGRYTHADPDKFAARYRAAREYERVEASKLGLAIRPDRIAEGMTGRRG
jgi:hypothetical protein